VLFIQPPETNSILKSSDVFRFKQFQIAQNRAVHRVGTDGVLLGAWTNIYKSLQILDVGTGTGLIALMLAQRTDPEVNIEAIEPDAFAFELATHNICESPYKQRVSVFKHSFQNFISEKKYDLIVCNPPFFENSLKPPNEQRSRERHSESLPHPVLIGTSNNLLSPSGRLAIILPVTEGNGFIKLAGSSGLNLSRQCAVFSKETKPQERWLLEFSVVQKASPEQSKLTLLDSKGSWTDEYRLLTKNFYLHF